MSKIPTSEISEFVFHHNILFMKQQCDATKVIYDLLKETWVCQAIGEWLESLASREYLRDVTALNHDASWFLLPEEHAARWCFFLPLAIFGISLAIYGFFSPSFAEQRKPTLKVHPKSSIFAAFFFIVTVYSKYVKRPVTLLHCFMPCYWFNIIWVIYGFWPSQFLFNCLICFRGIATIGFATPDFEDVTWLQIFIVVTMHVFQLTVPTYLLMTTPHTVNRSSFFGLLTFLLPATLKLYLVVPLSIYFGINGSYTLYLRQLENKYYYTPMFIFCIMMNVGAHVIGRMEQKLGREWFPNYPREEQLVEKAKKS